MYMYFMYVYMYMYLSGQEWKKKKSNFNCSVSADHSGRYRKKMSKQIKRTDCFDVEVEKM